MLHAGRLDTHGTFQTPTEGKDARGGRTITAWPTFATVWAAVRPSGANERLAAAQMGEAVDYELEIRTVPGLTSKMRFVADDGRVFVIKGIRPLPREGRMLLSAQVVT